MTKSASPDKDGRAPEQKIVDPLTGRNYTGGYAMEKREGFETALREVFSEIARKAFSGEPDILEPVMKKALECHNEYFQAMKGGTNIRVEDIKDVIAEEVERQNRFHHSLATLEAEFKKEDVRFQIMSPDSCYQDAYWDTGLVRGCNIRIGASAYLCAFPLVPARTTCYMALVQEPVAAQIIFVSEDCILLAPHSQDFGDDLIKAGEMLFIRRKELKEYFPKAVTAYLGNNFLCVDTDEEFSEHELKKLKGKYKVAAIVKGGPNFMGNIYTGKEDKMSVLSKEFGFD